MILQKVIDTKVNHSVLTPEVEARALLFLITQILPSMWSVCFFISLS